MLIKQATERNPNQKTKKLIINILSKSKNNFLLSNNKDEFLHILAILQNKNGRNRILGLSVRNKKYINIINTIDEVIIFFRIKLFFIKFILIQKQYTYRHTAIIQYLDFSVP